jgi:TetR/AcrR family transcriptional regulator, lmrAB and yxaGH operons repressor
VTTDGRRRDTRERLVRAATGLFRRRGVSGTGLAEVCARAGVTKGVFMHHFPGGKEELAAAVIARNGEDVRRALTGLGPAQALTMAAAVETYFASYAGLLRAKGTNFGCPVAAGVVDASENSPAVRQATHVAFDGWRAALRALPGAPSAVPVDELVVAALEGGILLARAAQDPYVLERVGHALADLIDADARTSGLLVSLSLGRHSRQCSTGPCGAW